MPGKKATPFVGDAERHRFHKGDVFNPLYVFADMTTRRPSQSHPNSLLHYLAALPCGLLERLLSAPNLQVKDLIALHSVAQKSAPAVAHAVQGAATTLLRHYHYGPSLLQSSLPGETPLSQLRFLSLLDSLPDRDPHTSLWSAGRNDTGQGVRLSSHDSNVLQPCFRLPSDRLDFSTPPAAVAALSAGSMHSAVITALGALHVAGSNSRGQLGVGDLTSRFSWTHIADLKWTRVAQVACGEAYTVVLTGDGSLFATGANSYGQLGLGDTIDRTRFERLPITGVVMIATGRQHTVCLLQDGTVFATGDNSRGQLGGSSGKALTSFQLVSCFGRKVDRIACGSDTTMMLTTENMVLVTGKRQCGLSVIGGLGTSVITHLVVGERFAIARTAQGEAALSVCRKRFYVSDELMHVTVESVSAGIAHYAVLCEKGSVLAAGANAFGQVSAGNMGLTIEGSPNARIIRAHQVPLSPVNLPSGYRALKVAAGGFHTLYLLAPND